MLSTIIQYISLTIIAIVSGICLAIALETLKKFWDAKTDRLLCEAGLFVSQAEHVDQTKAAEALNSEKLVKSYEGQGANKLRTELSRIGTFAELEKALQFKIRPAVAVSAEAHVALVTELGAKITSLEAEIARAAYGIPNDVAGSGTTSAPVAPKRSRPCSTSSTSPARPPRRPRCTNRPARTPSSSPTPSAPRPRKLPPKRRSAPSRRPPSRPQLKPLRGVAQW